MKIDSLSDIGIKRKENQDNFWSALLEVDGAEAGILCVCDGMGGLDNGRLASRIVVQSVAEAIRSGIPFNELESVIRQANTTIHGLALAENIRMGTTCTIIQCSKGIYQVLHIGDSRCYKVNEGTMIALTTDHSAIRQYGLSPEKDYDMWKKYKNSLTRCVGIKSDITIDYLSGSYEDGSQFLVCSDGFWHYLDRYNVSFNDIANLEFAVKQCMSKGETDNITACILYT